MPTISIVPKKMRILLPDYNGMDLTGEIITLLPGTRVLILIQSKIEYIAEASQEGDVRYLVKDSAMEKVMDAPVWISKKYYPGNTIQMKVLKHTKLFPKKEGKIKGQAYRTLPFFPSHLGKILCCLGQLPIKMSLSPYLQYNGTS